MYACCTYLDDHNILKKIDWRRKMQRWMADTKTKIKQMNKYSNLGFLGGNAFISFGRGSGVWDYDEEWTAATEWYNGFSLNRRLTVNASLGTNVGNTGTESAANLHSGNSMYISYRGSRGSHYGIGVLNVSNNNVLGESLSGTSFDIYHNINWESPWENVFCAFSLRNAQTYNNNDQFNFFLRYTRSGGNNGALLRVRRSGSNTDTQIGNDPSMRIGRTQRISSTQIRFRAKTNVSDSWSAPTTVTWDSDWNAGRPMLWLSLRNNTTSTTRRTKCELFRMSNHGLVDDSNAD